MILPQTDEELSKTASAIDSCNVEVDDESTTSQLSTRPPSREISVSRELLHGRLSVGSITATSVATATGSPSVTRPTTIQRSALERRPSNSSVMSTSVSSKQRSVTFKLDDDSDVSSNEGSTNEVIGIEVGMLSTILLGPDNSHNNNYNNNTEMASMGSNMSSNSALASNDDLGGGDTEGGYRSEGSIGLVHGTSREGEGTGSRRHRSMFGASLRRDLHLPWAGVAEVDINTPPMVSVLPRYRARTDSNSYDVNDALSSSTTATGRIIKAGRLTGTVITTSEEGLTQQHQQNPFTLPPLGESAQGYRRYRALMALMRTESVTSDVQSHQSHISTSGTSELSDETNTTRKSKRNLYLKKCARAIVVLVSLAAFSCAVLYFVAEEKVLPDKFYEQFFDKSLSEEDEENDNKNVRDLILKPHDSRDWGYDNYREQEREQKFRARQKRIEDRELRLRAKRDREEQRFLSGNAGHSMLVRVSFVEGTSPKDKKLDYSIVGYE